MIEDIYGLQVRSQWSTATETNHIVFVRPATYITFDIGDAEVTDEKIKKLSSEALAQINAHEKRKRKGTA